jgi:hypothetical protein
MYYRKYQKLFEFMLNETQMMEWGTIETTDKIKTKSTIENSNVSEDVVAMVLPIATDGA